MSTLLEAVWIAVLFPELGTTGEEYTEGGGEEELVFPVICSIDI